MRRVPKYIRDFMGDDFRSVEGVNVHFDLKKFFDNPDYDCGVQNRPGCYIISTDGINIDYANGKSRILYIGLSDKLLDRLYKGHFCKHLKKLMKNPDEGLEGNYITIMQNKYQYMLRLGAKVDVFYCKGTQNAKEFESSLLANFYYKYRCIPLGNSARSFSQK